MLIAFFDDHGLIYQHIEKKQVVKPGDKPRVSINKEYYAGVLKTLMRHIRLKHPHLVNKWILHHDNARPPLRS